MDKKTFVCETIKAILIEKTKVDHIWMIRDTNSANVIIDKLADTLSAKYDQYLKDEK